MTVQSPSRDISDSHPPPERSRSAAVWLAAVALLIIAMLVVGGATRVTGSGLSITQWQLVSGIIPPLGHRAWEHMFQLYQQTPQYRLLNRGMSLSQFQSIFWWEWAHRLLGRALGVVFLVPLVVLVVTRRLPKRLIWRCAILFMLGGLQGAVGWWMVKSGLEARTSVAPERLAAHLGLALALLCACVWTSLEAWFGPQRGLRRVRSVWPSASAAFLILVFLQCLLGALVAGNHAGLIDADWPMMGGRLIPEDYWAGSLWASIAHSPAATQFNHRLLAYGLLGAGWAIAVFHRRGLAWVIALVLTLQATLGVTLLLFTVPLPLALTHQCLAAALVTLAAAFSWQVRRAGNIVPVHD